MNSNFCFCFFLDFHIPYFMNRKNVTRALFKFKQPDFVPYLPMDLIPSDKRPVPAVDYKKRHEKLCQNSWEKQYTKLHHEIIEKQQNKFLIYTCSGAGWGNRIRRILPMFYLAVITKRAFIIECDKPISLDRYIPPAHAQWNYKVNKTGLSVRHGYAAFRNVKNQTDPKEYENDLTYNVEYNARVQGPLTHRMATLLKFSLPNVPFYGCAFYYLFRKSHDLESRFSSYKAKVGFHDNFVIGIHIREGDRRERYKPGDIDKTCKCAEDVEKIFSKKYNTTKIIWFLAADFNDTKTSIIEKYGKKVKYIEGPIEHVGHPRRGYADIGQLNMFLDIFLLQETDFNIYGHTSTFDHAVEAISPGKQSLSLAKRGMAYACTIPNFLNAP